MKQLQHYRLEELPEGVQVKYDDRRGHHSVFVPDVWGEYLEIWEGDRYTFILMYGDEAVGRPSIATIYYALFIIEDDEVVTQVYLYGDYILQEYGIDLGDVESEEAEMVGGRIWLERLIDHLPRYYKRLATIKTPKGITETGFFYNPRRRK
jgi:hypothetical protein